VIGWFVVGAQAQDLPAVAEREGFAAAYGAMLALSRQEKPKKLDAALAAAGLSRLAMPATTALGADLVIRAAGPATGCTLSGEVVACRLPLATTAKVGAGEYAVSCRSRLGASLPVESALADGATEDRAELRLTDLGPCWKLGGDTLVVTPVSGIELEGVGQGTDLIPPELVGLTKHQVEEIVKGGSGAFQHCLVSAGKPGLTGKLVVAYRIGPDGRLAEVSAESSTLGEPAVEACVLDRFRTLTFPKPNDGWDRGTWPVTFQ
jgi:hypothetical protein